MKLRRAMAVAAATAVIAPAAFLAAAPVAFATTGGTTSTTSGSTGDTGTVPAEDTTPGEDTTPADETPAEETKPEGETPAEETKPEGETPAGDTKPDEETKPGEDTKPDEDTKPGEEDPAEDGEDEEFPICEEGDIQVSLGGFPNKIVAGSGWKNFTFDAENTGKNDIESLQVYTVATYGKSPEDFDDRLIEKYAHFEYKDPSGKWVNDFAGSGINNGIFFGEFALDAGQKVSIDLRVKIDKAAPAGDGLALAAGGYDNGAEDETFECFENGDVYPFQVIKAGSDAGDVEDSEPTGEKPSNDVKPQGEAKPIEVTGNLAETGSSSVLPAIGIAGGVAVVAGAGVVFAMKRRKGDAIA
ncbi:LPXTG cell wall anchor domain-containing protein [Streptomyces sp. NPDC055709]